MDQDRVHARPKAYPPPEFPPRKVATFARTPPAIFPVIFGLLGLAIALRTGLQAFAGPKTIADLATGLVLPIWAFGIIAYFAKIYRRNSVIFDDLKVLPSRAGLAAATLGGMAAAGLAGPFAPGPAAFILFAALALHLILAGLTVLTLLRLPPESREVNPGWHMTFVGFIVGAPAAVILGYADLAKVLLYATLPVAVVIWGVSLRQFLGRVPPAPLRPMLAIHLAPASLFTIVATQTGNGLLANLGTAVVMCLLAALVLRLRWITASGFSPLWGAFTFPLTAAATALLGQGGALAWLGLGLLTVALVAVPWIAWKVLSLWPGGRLADKTNAAEA
jgi:tellurite resistance protein